MGLSPPITEVSMKVLTLSQHLCSGSSWSWFVPSVVTLLCAAPEAACGGARAPAQGTELFNELGPRGMLCLPTSEPIWKIRYKRPVYPVLCWSQGFLGSKINIRMSAWPTGNGSAPSQAGCGASSNLRWPCPRGAEVPTLSPLQTAATSCLV